MCKKDLSNIVIISGSINLTISKISGTFLKSYVSRNWCISTVSGTREKLLNTNPTGKGVPDFTGVMGLGLKVLKEIDDGVT